MGYRIIEKDSFRTSINDRQDCGVITLALVCNLPYIESYAKCLIQGRKPRKGMSLPQLLTAIITEGYIRLMYLVYVKRTAVDIRQRQFIKLHRMELILH